MGHRGFIFHLPGFDSCGEKGKVGSELMCLFVEKLLSFKKRMRPRAKRSLKEPSRDALRKRLNFHSPFFKDIFYLFDASSISDYMCSMHFHVVHTVYVEKAEISCHRTYLEILNLRLSSSTMPLYMFLNSQRISKNARKCFVLQGVVPK